jgi:hypothetical protein
MKYLATIILTFIFAMNIYAQETKKSDDLPYYQVPEYGNTKYTAGTVTARMVDGLGFRYRWATEDLREEDLQYKASDSARTILETVDHLLNLSRVILNSTLKVPTDFTKEKPTLTYEEKRKETLQNFEKASAILMKAKSLKKFKIIFIAKKGESQYPFWNQINGPIADAIWHSGQIATLRRAAGNPLSSKVSFLRGKIRE